jgi:hypothetical protein
MSTLAFRIYIFSLVSSIVIVGAVAYVITMMALVSFLLGVIDMVLLGWYVDPIYIVIGALLFVFLFLARIDNRFRKIEKILRGVNDASQVTSQNSGHLLNIDYNTTPSLVAEHIGQRTSQVAVPIGQWYLPSLDSTEPIRAISFVDSGTGVQSDEPKPASFCSNCGTPTRQVSGSLRPIGDR